MTTREVYDAALAAGLSDAEARAEWEAAERDPEYMPLAPSHAEHTPEEWKMGTAPTLDGRPYVVNGSDLVVTMPLAWSEEDKKVRAVRVRLIKAAPRMLAALKDAEYALIELEAPASAVDIVTDAIAEAEGDES